MPQDLPKPKKKRLKHDYIDNKKFTQAVADHVANIKAAEEAGEEIPVPPHYVGESLLLIARGVARKPNFSGYPFIEDMVMDGVENCIRYIKNFNINAPTKSGKPSAFSYFTQIIHYAFIRRLQKEKKQIVIKERFKSEGNLADFADFGDDHDGEGRSMIEKMRCRDEFYREDRSLHPTEEETDEEKENFQNQNIGQKIKIAN